MATKYWTDRYGNEYYGTAQIGKMREPLFNPERESLDIPPQHGLDSRVRLVDGVWKIEQIYPHHKRLKSGEIVDKSMLELIRDLPGEFPKPSGMKLSEVPISEQTPDGLILEPKTIDEQFSDGEFTEQEVYQIKLDNCIAARRMAYVLESDPLFFDWQRGVTDKKTWIDAVDAIKVRYPKPEKLLEEGDTGIDKESVLVADTSQ